jgi:hypothetical protein
MPVRRIHAPLGHYNAKRAVLRHVKAVSAAGLLEAMVPEALVTTAEFR